MLFGLHPTNIAGHDLRPHRYMRSRRIPAKRFPGKYQQVNRAKLGRDKPLGESRISTCIGTSPASGSPQTLSLGGFSAENYPPMAIPRLHWYWGWSAPGGNLPNELPSDYRVKGNPKVGTGMPSVFAESRQTEGTWRKKKKMVGKKKSGRWPFTDGPFLNPI